MMLRRLDAGETPAFEGKVFEDLAKAAGVDAHWLQTGEGEPVPASAPEEVSAFEGALGWFVATEEHEGRGDAARRFLAQREQVNAGAAGLSPDAWLAKLRDEYRAWRRPAKAVGVTEIGEDEPVRASKLPARRR
jgi:hypothetical protein